MNGVTPAEWASQSIWGLQDVLKLNRHDQWPRAAARIINLCPKDLSRYLADENGIHAQEKP
jgi:hypothetical protein